MARKLTKIFQFKILMAIFNVAIDDIYDVNKLMMFMYIKNVITTLRQMIYNSRSPI